jgi:hypothetical protein
VIGLLPSTAQSNLRVAGFTDVTTYGDLSSGPKNKIQAQNPDATECIALTTPMTLHYRLP